MDVGGGVDGEDLGDVIVGEAWEVGAQEVDDMVVCGDVLRDEDVALVGVVL